MTSATTQRRPRVVVAHTSGFGHTARLAEAVHEGAGDDGVTLVDAIDVGALDDVDWEALDRADAMIWGSPTYMGDVSAKFRTFAEATSGRWLEGAWRGKLAAGFTTSSCKSGDKVHALTSLVVFAAQHGMIWVSLGLPAGWNHSRGSEADLNRLGVWLGAAAQCNGDEGPNAMHEADLATARELGRRVAAETALRVAGESVQRETMEEI
jgi:NAD(P)H dehydrogenase (quinone)